MIKEYFKKWNKFEITLLFGSIIAIIISGVIFRSEILVILCSMLSITTAILQSKGKVESQFVSIVTCLVYSVVSFKNRYYGEVIFYMLIMLPMSIGGIISWITHKNDKTDTVEVNELKLKEWILLILVCIIAFIGLYKLLDIFNTNELLISTFSMIASLLAVYLLVRRSKYCFIFYILNDTILILLWGIPILSGNLLLIPMIVDLLALLISDCYGSFNWNRMEKKQI